MSLTNGTYHPIVLPQLETKLSTPPLPPVETSSLKLALLFLLDDVDLNIKFINPPSLYHETSTCFIYV